MSLVTDPLNRSPLREVRKAESCESSEFVHSFFAMPDAVPLVWAEPNPEAAKGTVTCHRIRSDILGNERNVWLYLPVNAPNGTGPMDLLVLFDGEQCVQEIGNIPQLLDNLHAADAIAPMAAIMIDNVDRSAELPCNPDFARFLAEELAPWVRQQADVTIDPKRTIVSGWSYGGLAAAFAALRHPDVFGNVLSQSGSYWWRPDPYNEKSVPEIGVEPESTWLISAYVAAPLLPIRFFLEAGTLETQKGYWAIASTPTLLGSNRHFRDVLTAKGYDVQYREFPGGHDYAWWRGTMADGILALLRARTVSSGRRWRGVSSSETHTMHHDG